MRRVVLAPLAALGLLSAIVWLGVAVPGMPASAQTEPVTSPVPALTPPPPPAPRTVSTPPATVTPAAPASPGAVPPAAAAPASASPQSDASAAPSPSAIPASPSPLEPGAFPSPTQPPIIVEPPGAGVQPGQALTLRVNAAFGTILATVADPAVALVSADSGARTITVFGKAVGTTTVTVKDDRGLTRDVAVRVAYNAGAAAASTMLRITGDPATAQFVRERAVAAAVAAATVRPGSTATASADAVALTKPLAIDNLVAVDVPLTISGDGYFTVSATTHVMIENVALPRISPAMLLVSDYPETLHANGVLFTATLERRNAQRFLYYHYNPGTEPARRVLLKVQNTSPQPALVQMISGSAGPETNELQVGHLSTQRFLVHEANNEGEVIEIPGNGTINLVDHPLPPRDVISALLQLREVDGNPLKLTLVAQDAKAPTDTPPETTELLSGGAAHARGAYPVPEFYFDYLYPVDGADLEIPIGQLPLPNLRKGEALSGDYGVQQSITVRIINNGRGAAPIALYANPRGGRATGTFIIDRTLVQMHAAASFAKPKLWQASIAPHTFRTIQITTMPEGGSSYPLRLIFGPDDGSVAPGGPGSPVD